MTKVQELEKVRRACWKAFKEAANISDEKADAIFRQAWDMDIKMLTTPAANLDDVRLKLAIWDTRIRDFGGDMFEGQTRSWRRLKKDIAERAAQVQP